MQHHFKAYFMVGKQKFCLRDICTIFLGEYNKMSQDSFWCMVLQKIETDFSWPASTGIQCLSQFSFNQQESPEFQWTVVSSDSL